MLSNFYWAVEPSAKSGGIAGMACPYGSDLRALQGIDIGLIVSLLAAEPYGPNDMPGGTRMVRFAVESEEAPDENRIPELMRVLAFVHAFRRQEDGLRSVVVHCSQGIQRTGMFLEAYRWYCATADPQTCETWNAAHYRPNSRQNRFVDRLPGRAQGLVGTGVTDAAIEELRWRRSDSTPRTSGRRVWRCPLCEEGAHAPRTAIPMPLWCPSCGYATERTGLARSIRQ